MPVSFRQSRVLARWRAKHPALCTFVQSSDPMVAEMVALSGYDCVWIDFEHSSMTLEGASHVIRAARAGDCDVMARPARGEFSQLERLLEAGASGVLYPRCEGREEAIRVVGHCRFAPLGSRGFAGTNPDSRFSLLDGKAYMEAANRETFVALQIESPEGVVNSRAIAEVPGVDLLFFGPADYALLSGHIGELRHSEVTAACERTCQEALAAGKRFGTVAFDLDHARRLLEIGASLINFGSDVRMLRDSYAAAKSQLAGLGFGFGR